MVKIDISENALNYLKSLAEPFEDTPRTVFDRIVKEHRSKTVATRNSKSAAAAGLSFGIADIPDVTFTTISSAVIDNDPLVKKDWNTVLSSLIERCLQKDQDVEKLRALLDANTLASEPNAEETKKGFRYIPEANLSFQGLDAIRACRNIMLLSKQYSVPVGLTIKWGNNEKADFPGKSATITLP